MIIGLKITLFPFSSGYAITLAHPIRRLIMNSTPGYAPIAVKIEGADHEFDNILGMLEDVAIFIMNLKSIRFKLKDESQTEATIDYSFSGHCEILAQDLDNDQVAITTPEQHLATLNHDGNLNFSLIIKKGIGYVASEDFRDELEEHFIPIDAFFSPVKKAIYHIEKMLVKDDASFEKVSFEIITDGQITPVEAFKNAVTNMNAQMGVFRKIVNLDTAIAHESKPLSEQEDNDIQPLLVPIEELNLSARSFNSLDKNHIRFLGQIIIMTDSQLKGIKNLGKKSYEEIIQKVKEYNFSMNYHLTPAKRKRLDAEVIQVTGSSIDEQH